MKNMLLKIEAVAAELQAYLDRPVLCGTPYLLAQDYVTPYETTPIQLLYGRFYADQTGGTNEYGFRYQRENHLCGCLQKSPESADLAVIKANARKTEGELPVYKLHARDWYKAQLVRVNASIAHLKAAIAYSESPK
jgi:hypothetical protein